MSAPRHWFVTGASGLLGARALRHLLDADDRVRATVLLRDAARWPAVAGALGARAARVEFVTGDVTHPALGVDRAVRARLGSQVDGVLHAAADTTFSRPLADARQVNMAGTAHFLDLVDAWPHLSRFVHLSTAFVAGRLTGAVGEADDPSHAGWVNGYEQSKWEAELLVRAARADWLVLRPSTIVCDDRSGTVTQLNAVHRALRVYRAGLAAMMPATAETTVDVVPADWVSRAIAVLATRTDVAARTIHLCAGAGAFPLAELIDESYAHWSRDTAWRSRGIPQPALVDLETYALFERTVEETGDRRLQRVLHSLSHFVPQLAYPKRFDTATATQLLGEGAPAVRDYWPRMMDHLLRAHWNGPAREAA